MKHLSIYHVYTILVSDYFELATFIVMTRECIGSILQNVVADSIYSHYALTCPGICYHFLIQC